jgi:hypothetical protein
MERAELGSMSGHGAWRYTVDIEARSGYRNVVSGIQPDAGGLYVIDEEDLSPGEVNFVRIRVAGSGETCPARKVHPVREARCAACALPKVHPRTRAITGSGSMME